MVSNKLLEPIWVSKLLHLSKGPFILLLNLIKNTIQIFVSLSQAKLNVSNFISFAAEYCTSSIAPVFIINIALGVVIGVQLGPEFVARGLGSQMGVLSSLMMIRELSPVIGCLMIATQFGTGIAAEIANMKVSEQVDALQVLGVKPLDYLVLPRFVTLVAITPFIVWISALLGITSCFMTVWLTEGVYLQSFLGTIWGGLKLADIAFCSLKASIFGAIIVIISSTLGLDTKGGAKEVGQATTLTVILCFLAIIITDFIITSVYL